jgi:hypothetical protein
MAGASDALGYAIRHSLITLGDCPQGATCLAIADVFGVLARLTRPQAPKLDLREIHAFAPDLSDRLIQTRIGLQSVTFIYILRDGAGRVREAADAGKFGPRTCAG